EHLDDAIFETDQASAIGSDPEIALGILEDGAHHVVGQTVLRRQRLELAIAPECQAAACADPEVSAAIDIEAVDDVVRQAGGCAEGRELPVAQTIQPAARTDP